MKFRIEAVNAEWGYKLWAECPKCANFHWAEVRDETEKQMAIFPTYDKVMEAAHDIAKSYGEVAQITAN